MQTRRRRYDRTVLVPGQILHGLDTYRVGEVIGEGSYAVVYAATSSRNLPVAIKEFVPGLSVAEREHFQQIYRHERDVLWSLRHHPQLPDLIEAFSSDGMDYLVLEYIQGPSLYDRLNQEGPIPPNEVGPIALQLAGALAAFHAHGLVHHDVKPSNVKLSETGLVILLDLGSSRFAGHVDQALAAITVRPTAITPTSEIAGTPGYMAPELKEMTQTDTMVSDFWLDVFALGCTIHELITNKHFDQERIDVRDVTLIEQVEEALTQLCPELSDPVLKAISLKLEERYPSAQEMLHDLQLVIPPKPAVRQSALEFDLTRASKSEEVEQILVISNKGGGSLFGTVRSGHPAIMFRSPEGGRVSELSFEGYVTAIRVVADVKKITSKELEEGKIEVTTPDGDLSVTCQLKRGSRRPIALTVTPGRIRLEVTANTIQRATVKVENRGGEGGQVIAYTSPFGQVQVSPANSYLPPGAEVNFSIRPAAGVHRGIHQVSLSFRSESGESRADIQVLLWVRPSIWQRLFSRKRKRG